jgi:tetratricopeptide (TPR) repeat protein
MTRLTTGSDGRQRGRLLALLVAPLFVLARPALAEPTAGNHYERALGEVQAGKLREARRSFEEAYRLSPHYIVLNNLGRVCFDLGDFDAARGYFEKFLEQGGEKIPPADRARVELLLARMRAGSSVPDATLPPTVAPTLQTSEPLPPPTRPASPAPGVRPVPEMSPPVQSDRAWRQRLEHERRTTLAVSLGATGAVMAAAGATVLVWNARRYGDYEAERVALGGPPFTTIRSQEELDRSLAYERAHAKNQADLDSVKDFDIVGYSLLGVGGALLATGAVLYLTRPGEGTLSVGIGRVDWGFRF